MNYHVLFLLPKFPCNIPFGFVPLPKEPDSAKSICQRLSPLCFSTGLSTTGFLQATLHRVPLATTEPPRSTHGNGKPFVAGAGAAVLGRRENLQLGLGIHGPKAPWRTGSVRWLRLDTGTKHKGQATDNEEWSTESVTEHRVQSTASGIASPHTV